VDHLNGCSAEPLERLERAGVLMIAYSLNIPVVFIAPNPLHYEKSWPI
jgi:hypothetical protein